MDKKYTMRYASLQGAYWLGSVATLTFVESFLLPRGFSEAGVGLLLAFGYLFALVLEPLASTYADRENGISLRTQIAAGFALTVLFSLGLLLYHGVLVTSVLFVAVATIMLVLLPLINAVSFSYSNRGIAADFSFGRGIGSAAFVLSSFLGGLAVKKNPDISMGILLLGGGIGFIFAILFAPGEKGAARTEAKGQKDGVWSLLISHPQLWPLLAANTCLMASHNFLNTYMLNLLAPTGYGAETVGILGAIGAIMELPVLLGFRHIAKWFRREVLLIMAAAMFVLKAVLSSFPVLFGAGVWSLYVATLLQLFAFAVFLPVSSVYVNTQVEPKDQAKGQMLLTETQVLGTVFCTLLGGFGISRFGTGGTSVLFMAIGMVGVLFAVLAVRKGK